MANKKYILSCKIEQENIGMYFKSKISKGIFHYVFMKEEATKLTKQQANKLLEEIKLKEKFELMEVK